ncbi:hypothetical protein [Marinigracilibium pacificum]|uniref:Lipocalin-like domain-containing protein n=1 Tax=Marinigracilibium pacificum TaxID=2729599 RepID=A0A848J7J2_9BACT|nr:hypothetical protein [Marinigracilibium pacificum]NMM50369.1 hypothetical protein [Marinigracilibium pacificum]
MKILIKVLMAVTIASTFQSCYKPGPAVPLEGIWWTMVSYRRDCNPDDFVYEEYDCEKEYCTEYIFRDNVLNIYEYNSMGEETIYQYAYQKNGNQIFYDKNNIINDGIGEVVISYNISGRTLNIEEYEVGGCHVDRVLETN